MFTRYLTAAFPLVVGRSPLIPYARIICDKRRDVPRHLLLVIAGCCVFPESKRPAEKSVFYCPFLKFLYPGCLFFGSFPAKGRKCYFMVDKSTRFAYDAVEPQDNRTQGRWELFPAEMQRRRRLRSLEPDPGNAGVGSVRDRWSPFRTALHPFGCMAVFFFGRTFYEFQISFAGPYAV